MRYYDYAIYWERGDNQFTSATVKAESSLAGYFKLRERYPSAFFITSEDD